MGIDKQRWSNMPDVPEVEPEIATNEVLICYNIPWNTSYTHVRLYNNVEQFVSVLRSDKYLVMDIKNTAPVKFGEYTFDVGANATDMARCNYIAFRNSAYSPDWFFGFITGVKWLSPNSTRLTWEPDVWQNNIYNSVLGECFVEREHVPVNEDSPWKIHPPEDFELGEYVIQKSNLRTDWGWKYGMLNTGVTGGLINYGNVFNGLTFYSVSTMDEMRNKVEEIKNDGKSDAIVSIFQYPDIITLGSTDASIGQIFVYPDANIDGYHPKNNRLFSFPYVFCEVYSAYSAPQTYQFEYSNWNQNNTRGILFKLKGTPLPTPIILVVPAVYKGFWDNYEEAVTLTGFPQGAWTNDVYQAFLAQSTPYWNYQQEMTQLQNRNAVIQGGMSAIGSLLNMNLGGAITAGVNTALGNEMRSFQTTQGIVAAKESHALIPNSAHGNLTTPYIHAQAGVNSIFYYVKTIKNEFAEIIDNFFEMYGYAVNKLKVPNINSRRYWNFVKTQDCQISGISILQEKETLESIFNRGVTIWHVDAIGDYTFDNHYVPS